MTHAYCASGVVQFSNKRSLACEALSERRGAICANEGRQDEVDEPFRRVSACRDTARSRENRKGEMKRKNFSFRIFRMKSLVQAVYGRGRCGNEFTSAPEHSQRNCLCKRLR